MYWGNGVCSRGSRRVGNRVVKLGGWAPGLCSGSLLRLEGGREEHALGNLHFD